MLGASSMELIGSALVMMLAVCGGTIVHELVHAVVLHVSGVEYRIHWRYHPTRHRHEAGSVGALASVEPQALPPDLPPWHLRVAALSPLVLATPLLAIALGILPDPFASDNLYLHAAFIGWLACALPSPQDFSLVFHAATIINDGEYAPTNA